MEMLDDGYKPPKCLCCMRLQRFTAETHTMYKIGMRRLGIFLAILGAACLPEAGALMALNDNSPWSGIGIWVGVPVRTLTSYDIFQSTSTSKQIMALK